MRAEVTKPVEQLERVIVRFVDDSGDGMQLTSDRFTQETAAFGNNLSTLPNFSAEIGAPAGTIPGVYSFQLHFASRDILTPGDHPHVLVAVNPAALPANVGNLGPGAVIITDPHDFAAHNLTRVLAAAHRGTSLVETYQNWPIFNDGAFDAIKNPHPTLAFAISRLTGSSYLNQSTLGIFRAVDRPAYGNQTRVQVRSARDAAGGAFSSSSTALTHGL